MPSGRDGAVIDEGLLWCWQRQVFVDQCAHLAARVQRQRLRNPSSRVGLYFVLVLGLYTRLGYAAWNLLAVLLLLPAMSPGWSVKLVAGLTSAAVMRPGERKHGCGAVPPVRLLVWAATVDLGIPRALVQSTMHAAVSPIDAKAITP